MSTYEGTTPEKQGMSPKDAMMMNRRQRRILGKRNGARIPGIIRPYVKKESEKPLEETNNQP